MCRLVEHDIADVYIIACASDPGIEAVRATTPKPVLGIFRSAVATAVARAERFGVIGLVDASKGAIWPQYALWCSRVAWPGKSL
jgi:Asp/Glu/hydantoin racemase